MYCFSLLYPRKCYHSLVCVVSVPALTSETIVKDASYLKGLISGKISEWYLQLEIVLQINNLVLQVKRFHKSQFKCIQYQLVRIWTMCLSSYRDYSFSKIVLFHVGTGNVLIDILKKKKKFNLRTTPGYRLYIGYRI